VTSPDSEADPWYLRGLMRCSCGVLMDTTTRGETRFYRCAGTCGRRVDAIGVETEVWQRATELRPALLQADTPAAGRREALAPVVLCVELRPAQGLTFRLRWQPAAARRTSSSNPRRRRGGLSPPADPG
jgi:hypothetical protein